MPRTLGALLAVLILTGIGRLAATGPTVDEVLQADSRDPAAHVTVERVTYAPGESSPKHRHPDMLVAVMVRGVLESQFEGEALKTYGAGDS